MADQERNPEVDRLMEELWETNDAEASPEKIGRDWIDCMRRFAGAACGVCSGMPVRRPPLS